jgi:hypothetical protein
MSASKGGILPGAKIVPERVRENRDLYYPALKTADRTIAILSPARIESPSR